jgi:hypothetical protein
MARRLLTHIDMHAVVSETPSPAYADEVRNLEVYDRGRQLWRTGILDSTVETGGNKAP